MGKSTKSVDGFKKAHHGNLGEKPSKRLSRQEEEDVEDYLEEDWEGFCGACDNFGDEENCPFFPTSDRTRWKEELNCEDFWD